MQIREFFHEDDLKDPNTKDMNRGFLPTAGCILITRRQKSKFFQKSSCFDPKTKFVKIYRLKCAPQPIISKALSSVVPAILRPKEGQYLSILRHAKICFSFIPSVQNPLTRFGVIIGHELNRLRSLELTFECGKELIPDQVLRTFTNEVCCSLPKLKSLTFRFNYAKISSQGIRDFTDQIPRNLPKLQHVGVHLKGNMLRIADPESEYLVNKLSKSLSHLTCISLGFQAGERFTGARLADFGLKMSKITKLELDLSNNKDLESQVFIEIIRNISRNMIYLKHLSLNLSGCGLISNIGLSVALFDLIDHQTRLQELIINFSNCRSVSTPAIELIALKIYKKKPSLKHLSWNFKDCCTDSKKLQEKWTKLLNFIPKLELSF